MKTIFKNKVLVLLSAFIMLFCGVIGASLFKKDDPIQVIADKPTSTPTLTIESNNVSYSESIYILYAVSNEGFDRTQNEIKMLFWEEVQEDYVVGTELYSATDEGSKKVKGKDCLIFYSEGLAAKEMTTDIYSRAYVEIDGVAYYSDVMKFSVLEYVYTMKENGGLTTNQQNLFNNMLNYGASAQYQFVYNVDRIANGDYYSITIINGKLPDGFAHGRYKNKEKIKVKADKAPEGMKFSHWEDEKGIIISYDEQITITLEGNKTYIAVYKDISNVATQLVLTSEVPYNGDLDDIELPTAVSFDYQGETVTLEVTWNTDSFKTEQLGVQTLYATLVDQSAYKKYDIAVGGIVMNITTQPYTYAIDQTTGEYIITGYYGADTEITLPTSYKNTFITTIASKAFNKAMTLTKVVIPNTYKKIENAAFFLCDNIAEITVPFIGETAPDQWGNTYGATWFGWIFGTTNYEKQYALMPIALKTVNLTEGATLVPSYAFYQCSQIENLNLPSTITIIYDYAFQYCTAITEFTIPDELTYLGWNVFYGSNLKRVNASSVDKIISLSSSPFGSGADLYIKGKLLTELTVPVGTEYLSRSFSYCTSIQTVVLPETLTYIESEAFRECTSLTSIVIPDSVTSFGSHMFCECDSLTNVVIGNSVTSLGWGTFYYCRNLTNVVIGDSVTSIGGSVFEGCDSLTSVVIPDSVTSISDWAFSSCDSLTSVVIGDSVTSIGNYAFHDCTNLTNINIPDSVTSIAERAFYNCSSLTNVTIPELVYDIGNDAFSGCSNLSQLTILSKRLTEIGSSAFWGCTKLWEIYNLSNLEFTLGSDDYGYIAKYAKVIHTSLEEEAYLTTDENGFTTYNDGVDNILLSYTGNNPTVMIPNGVTIIKESALYNNQIITSVVIPDSVTTIGNSAFSYCDNLTSVVIGDSVTSIGNYAFGSCNSLTEIQFNAVNCPDFASNSRVFDYAGTNGNGITVTIGKNVTRIPAYLFYPYNSSAKITSIIFEDGSVCESIGNYAFYNCNSLTSVVIPDSVTTIGSYAFYSCNSLTSVVIGDSVTTIGSEAFYNCNNLTSVVIPDSVTTIGSQAFYNCYNLTSVVIGNSVMEIGNNAFESCYKLVEVVNYSSYITIKQGNSNNGYVGYYALAVYNRNDEFTGTKISNDNGFLVYTDGEEKILIGYVGQETKLTLPSYITAINNHAFGYCYNLTSVVIGDSVTTIGSHAFYDCYNLTSVVIADSVTTIGSQAFYNCYNLTSVVIPDSVTSISDWTFGYCYNLTSVVIGNSVTTIGYYAFYNCYNLASVVIGNSVTSIGSYAFAGCDSLTSVVIPDSVTTIYSDVFQNCDSLTSIVIGDSVTYICENAFSNTAYYNDKTNWENGVLYIGKYLINANPSISGVYAVKEGTSLIAYGAFYGCYNLQEVMIPESVVYINDYAFQDCESLTIYCEIANQPNGWSWSWNYSNCPVHWNNTGIAYTYTFETNGGEAIESVTSRMPITLPMPTKDGYYFCGWYDNAELTGQEVLSPYYIKANATLYAKWMTEEDYQEYILRGTSFEWAIHAECGTYNVVIDEAGEYVYFVFTATESRTYTIESGNNSGDTYGHLYNASQSEIASDDDSAGNNNNFRIVYDLVEGETYYIVARMLSSSNTGSFTITIA